MIGTHCDGLSGHPARSGFRRDADASQGARDDAGGRGGAPRISNTGPPRVPGRPGQAALRVTDRAPPGVAGAPPAFGIGGTPPGGPPVRRKGLTMRRHRLRLPSCRGNAIRDHKGYLSLKVGISRTTSPSASGANEATARATSYSRKIHGAAAVAAPIACQGGSTASARYGVSRKKSSNCRRQPSGPPAPLQHRRRRRAVTTGAG